jgi:hypothetical protein
MSVLLCLLVAVPFLAVAAPSGACAAWWRAVGALVLLAGTLGGAAQAQTLRPEVYVTNGRVSATALSDDGQTLYIGGAFTYVGPNTGSGVRIGEASGSVLPGGLVVNGTVRASVEDGAGGFYIGGDFTTVGGVTRNRLAHVLAGGTLDAAWDPNADNGVYALAVSGGVVYAGGNFTTVGGQPRNRLAALDATTGTLVAGFDPNVSTAGSTVNALAVIGTVVYAGGSFTRVNGTTIIRNRLASFDAATGTVTAWNPNVNNSVLTLAVSDGVVYAGGIFVRVNGLTIIRNRLASFDAATGTVTAWNPTANTGVYALAVSGGVVYAGGDFTSVGGQPRARLAALDASTGAVTAWNPNVSTPEASNTAVNALAVSGGLVYAGGNFTSVGGQPRSRLAALDPATGLATAWNPGANSTVWALAVSGGVVYAGGDFTTIGGQTRNRLAAIDAATGLAVTGFDPNANNTVNVLAVSGGTVYAGGLFTTVGGQPRQGLAVFVVGPTPVTVTQAAIFNPSSAPGDGRGYRLLGAPVAGVTVTDLASLNLVQGVAAGANPTTHPAQYPLAGGNLYTGYAGTGTASYTRPAADDVLTPGRGFFWQLYDQAIPASSGFGGGTSASRELTGFALSATGTAATADVSVPFADNTGAGADNFQMLANPFARPLAVSGITVSGGIVQGGDVFQAYNPNGSTYVLRMTGSRLAVWQGVFAELVPTTAGTPVTVTYSYAATDTNAPPPFYGRGAAVATAAPSVRFTLAGTLADGTAVSDEAAVVRLDAAGQAGWDGLDASKLTPPTSAYALVAPVALRDGTPTRLAVDTRAADATASVPLALTATAGGTFTLAWTATLPEGWGATLRDAATGQTVDLAADSSVAFTLAAAQDWATRFTLDLVPRGATAGEGGADAVFALSAPRPNPTTGTAALTLTLDRAQRVRAVVLDALGREVAVLHEGEAAGVVALSVDGRRLAPGVYVVRVAGASETLVRRVTVAR